MRTKKILGLTLFLAVGMFGCQGNYQSTIERIALNDFELSLIRSAESICPDISSSNKPCSDNLEGASCQWWCQETPYSHVPFGVTDDAVKYYEGLVRQFHERGVLCLGNPRYANFSYKATAKFLPSYWTGVFSDPIPAYRITLTLQFTIVCGTNCIYIIDAERVVYFREDGSLIEMYGDQPYGYSLA